MPFHAEERPPINPCMKQIRRYTVHAPEIINAQQYGFVFDAAADECAAYFRDRGLPFVPAGLTAMDVDWTRLGGDRDRCHILETEVDDDYNAVAVIYDDELAEATKKWEPSALSSKNAIKFADGSAVYFMQDNSAGNNAILTLNVPILRFCLPPPPI